MTKREEILEKALQLASENFAEISRERNQCNYCPKIRSKCGQDNKGTGLMGCTKVIRAYFIRKAEEALK